MIYALIIFMEIALFLSGLVLGYITPLNTKRATKKTAPKKVATALNEPQKEIQNFLNYDGSPQP